MKKYIHIFFLSWLVISCHVWPGIAQASFMSLNVKDSLIQLKAEDTPLIDVLKAISEKTGLSIKFDNTMEERISCEFKGISLESVIRQLLNKRSYALAYRTTENNRFVPSELWIVSENSYQSLMAPPLLEDNIKSYQKDWFKQALEDGGELQNMITIAPLTEKREHPGVSAAKVSEDPSFQKLDLKKDDSYYDAERSNSLRFIQPSPTEDAVKNYQKDWAKQEFEGDDRLADSTITTSSTLRLDEAGILITRVPEGSFFEKIGLKEGDIIHNVNGKHINAVGDFIQLLKSVTTAEEPFLMIYYKRADKTTNPIYVHFR